MTLTDHADEVDENPAARSVERSAAIALGIATTVVIVGRWWGQSLYWADNRMRIGAAPFLGRWDWEWHWWIVASAVGAAVFVGVAPRVAAVLPWRGLLLAASLAALAWSFGLAASEGLDRVSDPLVNRFEYYNAVPDVEAVGPIEFIDTYIDSLPVLPLHAKSHPPGMVLSYWGLAQTGASGPGWAAALVLGVAASGVAATLISVRSLAGEATARRAAPFLVLTPAAVWIGSTADGYFAGLAAWVTALFVLASARATTPRVFSVVAGGAGAVLLHMSYGAALMLLIPAAAVLYRRRPAVLGWACVGAAAVTAFFVVSGFWWFDGLDAARGYYENSSAQYRSYGYSLVGSPAGFALVLGPAAVAGIGALVVRRRRLPGLAVLAGASLAAVVAALISGMSTAEIERIWLPFTLPLLAAGAALPSRLVAPLLSASAVTAIVLETWLKGPW